MTRHQQIVLGGLLALLVIIVLFDRLVIERFGTRFLERLPEADRAVFKTRYRLLRRAIEAVIVFVGVIAVLFSFDQTKVGGPDGARVVRGARAWSLVSRPARRSRTSWPGS